MDLIPIYAVGGIAALIIGIVLLLQARIKGEKFKFKNLAILFTGTGFAILISGGLLMLCANKGTNIITVIRGIPMATIVIISAVIIFHENKK